MYWPYIHNPESKWNILWTRLKKKFFFKTRGRLGKHVLDSSVMKKTAAESMTKGKKLNPHMTYMVHSCQRNVI